MEKQLYELNQAILEHYDIIWQEDWYVFEDTAYALIEKCVEYGGNISDAAGVLARALYHGGDAPDQETWFDICDAVFKLTLAAYDEGIISEDFFNDFDQLYESR